MNAYRGGLLAIYTSFADFAGTIRLRSVQATATTRSGFIIEAANKTVLLQVRCIGGFVTPQI